MIPQAERKLTLDIRPLRNYRSPRTKAVECQTPLTTQVTHSERNPPTKQGRQEQDDKLWPNNQGPP